MNTTRPTGRWLPLSLVVGWTILAVAGTAACASDVPLKISPRPLHDGRINPMLFGNFIELLDDLVPGHVGRDAQRPRFRGSDPAGQMGLLRRLADLLRPEWDKGDDWTIETTGAFNGPRCARITGRDDRAAGLTQSGLAVKTGRGLSLLGLLSRSDGGNLRRSGRCSSRPCLTAASPSWPAELPTPTTEWTQCLGDSGGDGHDRPGRLRAASHRPGNGLGRQALADAAKPNRQRLAEGRRRGDQGVAIRRVIRWGGSVVDPGRYRWKNGIGDRDRRVPFANLNWGRIDSNDVGIDEFCQFCALVEAEPLVCVSFSDGPESAADLVQYCNGAADDQMGRPARGQRSRRALRGQVLAARQRDQRRRRRLYQEVHGVHPRDETGRSRRSRSSRRSRRRRCSTRSGRTSRTSPRITTRATWPPARPTSRSSSTMIANTPGCGHLRIAVTEWNFTGRRLGPAARQDADARRGAAQRPVPQPAVPLLATSSTSPAART